MNIELGFTISNQKLLYGVGHGDVKYSDKEWFN